MMKRPHVPKDEWQYRDRSSALVRSTLLRLTFEFVVAARGIPGVVRIAILGSLVTDKSRPKDADVLVTIKNDADLERLAHAGRRFQGRAQEINSTADIFLADTSSQYLGRICHYRECWPRVRCLARHCGARPHVNNDLDVVSLSAIQIASPPLVVYPYSEPSVTVPNDVIELLLRPLRNSDSATALIVCPA